MYGRKHKHTMWAVLHRENGDIVDIDMSFEGAKRKIQRPETERLVKLDVVAQEVGGQMRTARAD